MSIMKFLFSMLRCHKSWGYHLDLLQSRDATQYKIDTFLLNYIPQKMTQNNFSLQNGDSELLSDKVSKVFDLFQVVFNKYKPQEVFLSFNGGKDCTVLLQLVKRFFKENSKYNDPDIRVIYIQPENPFEEIEEFVDSCQKTYDIKIERVRGKLKNVLEMLCTQSTELQAVIMGCRRSDPFCENLEVMQPTDPGWPPLMRINPLLDWTCKDIWKYLLSNEIPYCTLYDEGYTSLGDKTNTKRNPELKMVHPQTGKIHYRPAYYLLDDNLERAGRS